MSFTQSRSLFPLRSSLILTLLLSGSSQALAEEVVPDPLPLPQVNQLVDVQPTDWAYQAVQALVEQYGCLEGFPDRTFQGDRPMTRYEFAGAIEACLETLGQAITNAGVSPDELADLQRLQTEFAAELTTLRSQIEALEVQTQELSAQQFSTTTRLVGQVVFALNAGGFDGDRIIGPTGEVLADDDPATTFIYRLALDFNTSFTGSDLLKVRLGAASGGARDNTAAVLEPNFGSGLDFSAKPPSDGNLEITRLSYRFRPWPDVTVAIAPNMRVTDYVDFSQYASLSFRDFSTEALVNNLILFPINGPTSGAFVDWHPNQGAFSLRALYAAADAANPTDTGILPGPAPFTRLLYPINGNPATADLGDRGLFGNTHQGIVELEYAPSERLTVRLQYGGGEVYTNRFDVLGVNAEWDLTRTVGIFGRYGYSSYQNTAFGDLNPQYWMAGVAARDWFREGSLAGVAIGQPFIEGAIGNATQTNLEAFYNLPLTTSIQITPVLQVITNASNQSENRAIVTGTIRTVFSF
ncbi:MAG: iron uptake porin [Leptolyngbyaceae bacterium]|nr:iron uptake porin [Leptolyngbyaceae bacterium]